MLKGTKQLAIVAMAALLLGGLAATAFAQGLVGQCADCHTMHNSEQGQPVALQGTSTTANGTANPNLLKMDCISCHASGGGEMIREMDGGSRIPQVLHTAETDLAAGNFRHIAAGGNRKGHNVVDVVTADSDLAFPPGYRHITAAAGMGAFDVGKFTCAGSMGCHGFRGQTVQVGFADPNCNPEFEVCGEDAFKFRTGLEALSGYDGSTTATLKRGAHHANYDGLKNNGVTPVQFFDNPLPNSYRFIRGLRGYGNQQDRWQNKDSSSHNEYAAGYDHTPIGAQNISTDFGSTNSCTRCHVGGQGGPTSRLTTPSSTITGFCITCHGSFHSSGVTNGSSGAFLRHPSDFALPDHGEYANYTTYNVTAPVGRPAAFFTAGMTANPVVEPGRDLVMCLSCHVAHASPHDGMLRFDYDALTSKMRAGSFSSMEEAQAEGGCFACHTTKGVAKGQ